jgi:CHAT domain-containing protein
VLAGPDYDAVLDEEEPLADQEIGGVSKSELTEFTSLLPFTTLSGAEAEGRILRSILPGTNVFIGAAASKTQLQSSHGPLVMHLATHGFFLEGSQLSDLVAIAKSDPTMHGRRHLLLPLRNETKLPRSLWDPNIKNPLIRSGLALAGVNHAQFGIRGVMTALEVSELDLWGTQLVVLSACDTGLGAVIFGQGVYGLRRAFLLAGAETLVMSLWKVSDAVTRDFMEGFYRRLRDGSGRSDALRSMQLELLRGNEYSHPFYWAAFILTGEWAPIKGW